MAEKFLRARIFSSTEDWTDVKLQQFVTIPEVYCSFNDLLGSFVTGCLWISYNTLMLCIFLCFAKRVKCGNVFDDYSLVWFTCFLNFIASLLNIILFFTEYYSDNHPYPIDDVPWPMLRATLSMTILGNIVYVLIDEFENLSTWFLNYILGPTHSSILRH